MPAAGGPEQRDRATSALILQDARPYLYSGAAFTALLEFTSNTPKQFQ